jgi:hypothetical protein
MREHPGHEISEAQETHFNPGGIPMGLIGLMVLIIGLGVWQFISLAPTEKDFPSDVVDMAVRGEGVVVYNPTYEIVDVYQVTIQRLSGSYSYTDRNLRPRSSRRISFGKFRAAGGRKVDMSEAGECRVRLEYWRGQEKADIFRYCRGF